jgi:hypothetical protein
VRKFVCTLFMPCLLSAVGTCVCSLATGGLTVGSMRGSALPSSTSISEQQALPPGLRFLDEEVDAAKQSIPYDSAIRSARALLEEGSFEESLEKISEERRLDDTEEARSLFDEAVLRRGESLYAAKQYAEAKRQLERVSYDQTWLKRATSLVDEMDSNLT